MAHTDSGNKGTVQTTGHAWDEGTLQEYNNPLPRWWLWSFYATVVFAVIYWFMYPAWPVGQDYTKGVLKKITYTVDGEEVTTHWNTRARLVKELQEGEGAVKLRQHLEQVAGADFDTILADPGMMDFTRKVARVLFTDNCAPCHGMGGEGKVGFFPNLVDDDWLWGGSLDDIRTTITDGRRGFMPAFARTFDEAQLDAVAEYVLGLSGHEVDAEKAREGDRIFNGETGGCYYCHTHEGTGMKSLGSANLTDKVWTIADVPAAASMDEKREAVKRVVRDGVSRVMPAWKERLSANEIKLLTIYAYDLGGGK